MKVTVACLAAALCTVVVVKADTNINSYGAGSRERSKNANQDSSYGQAQARSNQARRDYTDHETSNQQQRSAGHNYQGRANEAGQKSASAAERGNRANQQYTKNDAKYDETSKLINDKNRNNAYQVGSQGRYNKLDDNRARGYNAAAANKKAYNRGKVFNDNISYGFDKKFDQNLSERGGFEEENGHTAHRLDDYKDKQKGRKLIRGDHSAANARQDSQRALKETKYSQSAAQKQAANGKYGKKEQNLDKAGATQDAQSVLYDRKDSKFHAEDAGKQQAVNKANQFAKKDNIFGRAAAASKAGAQGHADKKYYGAHGNQGNNQGNNQGTGGYGSNAGNINNGVTGHKGGGAINHKYGEQQKQTDQGKEHLAQHAGVSDAAQKQYSQAKRKGEFAQIKSLRDQRNGKFAQGVHNANNNGYNNQNSQAAKSANGGDKKYADAAAQSNAKAAKHDLDEAAFDKENLRRNLQDRHENFKKLKRFYHDKKSGGNNFERLNYNRKRIENEFGQTQAAQKEHQNQFDKAHKSAKQNNDVRKANYYDARRYSNAATINNHRRRADGASNNNAQSYQKAAQKALGHRKDINEKDSANQRKSDSKKHRKRNDNTIGRSASTNNGHRRNSNGEAVRDGAGSSISGDLLRGDSIQNNRRRDFHADVSPIGVNGLQFNNLWQGDKKAGSTLGKFGNSYGGFRGRSVGTVNGKAAGDFTGLGNSGFGQNSGNFGGGNYASYSGGRSSVPRRGTSNLFNNNFGTFGRRSRSFGFGTKGTLF